MADRVDKTGQEVAVDVGTKFDFIAAVLANPEWRNRRKAPPLTPIDLAVMVKLVQRYNIAWGYSATSFRTVAAELGSSPATVHNAVSKLCQLDLLIQVTSNRANRANRYAPNFSVFSAIGLNSGVQGHDSEQAVQGYGGERGVQGHGAERKVMKRTVKEANVTGARSASPPCPSGVVSSSRAAANPTRKPKGKKPTKGTATVNSDAVAAYLGSSKE